MSKHTTSTENVRYYFAKPEEAGVDDWDVRSAQFDRWLAGVKAEAWDEGAHFILRYGGWVDGDDSPPNPYREATNE